jgi:hypothetical protein
MPGLDERRYQVFISSTFDDLQPERQKVLQAILEMKAFPAGMELFPSANDEQWAFIQREIESSDYYIVVTAGKYGSIAEDGRSFTEKEYDYALSLKKYVMSFVRRDILSLDGRHLELEQNRKQQLDAFHKKVKSSKLVKFYDSPEELKSVVMQALMHAFQFQPQEGWVRAKNARRIEDLEDVTRLQKQVMELQAENAKLSADPTAPFSQGEDTVEWTLHRQAIDHNDEPTDASPPVEFVFRTTWNELLAAIFSDADPEVERDQARRRVGRLIEVFDRFPHVSAWGALENGAGPLGSAEKDMSQIMIAIQRQFLGLALIDLLEWGWQLTQKGRLQLLGISGLRRTGCPPVPPTSPETP